MSAKHQTPQYQQQAKLLRQGVKSQHRRGLDVPCWRCGGAIRPGQPFDAGHTPSGALAPEHRHATTTCVGNRADGGAKGAAIRDRRTTTAAEVQTWQL